MPSPSGSSAHGFTLWSGFAICSHVSSSLGNPSSSMSGSHASPPSERPSVLRWSPLRMAGQLSISSRTPSPSWSPGSGCATVARVASAPRASRIRGARTWEEFPAASVATTPRRTLTLRLRASARRATRSDLPLNLSVSRAPPPATLTRRRSLETGRLISLVRRKPEADRKPRSLEVAAIRTRPDRVSRCSVDAPALTTGGIVSVPVASASGGGATAERPTDSQSLATSSDVSASTRSAPPPHLTVSA
jgi:hypothetical protein